VADVPSGVSVTPPQETKKKDKNCSLYVKLLQKGAAVTFGDKGMVIEEGNSVLLL
jgi:hypothetical protein